MDPRNLVRPRRPDDVAATADRILVAVSRPHLLSGAHLAVSASIGISLYPDDAQDSESLLKHADIAMYEAKAAGRKRFRFYDQDAPNVGATASM
jgi:diguanylate cyclase